MTRKARPRKPLRLGWLSTGRGAGSRGLLEKAQNSIAQGSLNASIEFVLSTRERGESEGSDLFLDQAESYGLKTIPLSFSKYRERNAPDADWRERYNERMKREISRHQVDALVFAGLLVVISDDIVNEYDSFNLHPADPKGPVGTWQEVIWELMLERSSNTGVSVQRATPQLDLGPVVAFCSFSLTEPQYSSLWQEAGNDWARKLETIAQKTAFSYRIQEPRAYFKKYSFGEFGTQGSDTSRFSPESAFDSAVLEYGVSLSRYLESPDANLQWPSLKKDWETRFLESAKEGNAKQEPTAGEVKWPLLKRYIEAHWREFRNRLAHNMQLENLPLFARIRQEGLRREALTLVEALRQVADGNVTIKDGEVRDAHGQPLENGLDITDKIETSIKDA